MPKIIKCFSYSLKVQLMQKPTGGLGTFWWQCESKKVQIAVILKVTSRQMQNAQYAVFLLIFS